MKFRPKIEGTSSGNAGEFKPAEDQRREIIEEPEIKKKIKEAENFFKSFLGGLRSRKNKAFTISFDIMLTNFGFLKIPPKRAMAEMDKIVMSIKGIEKTATGYTVSDTKLFEESLDAQTNNNKILKIFDENPNVEFTTKQIYIKLKLAIPIEKIRIAINRLAETGKVEVVGTVSDQPGRDMKLYKLASKVK